MPPGKPQRPLFELLRQDRAAGIPRGPAVDPPPPAPPTAEPAGRATLSPASGLELPSHDDREPYRRVAVPMPTIYAAGAFVVVLGVVCFSVGYSIGVDRGEQRQVEAALGLLDDEGAMEPAGQSPVSGSVGRPAATELEVTSAATGFIGPRGNLSGDPRVAGSNYLELAVLTRAQAVSALAMLEARGVRAFALQDGRGDRYRLIVLDMAVPSEAFSRLRGERQALERRLRDIGRAWKSAGGASDFAEPLWRRYDG